MLHIPRVHEFYALIMMLALFACRNDKDGDGVEADADCDDANPSLGDRAFDADCDGVLTAADCDDGSNRLGDQGADFDCDGTLSGADCDDQDALIGARTKDNDCDGIPAIIDCDDNEPALGDRAHDLNCDGDPGVFKYGHFADRSLPEEYVVSYLAEQGGSIEFNNTYLWRGFLRHGTVMLSNQDIHALTKHSYVVDYTNLITEVTVKGEYTTLARFYSVTNLTQDAVPSAADGDLGLEERIGQDAIRVSDLGRLNAIYVSLAYSWYNNYARYGLDLTFD